MSEEKKNVMCASKIPNLICGECGEDLICISFETWVQAVLSVKDSIEDATVHIENSFEDPEKCGIFADMFCKNCGSLLKVKYTLLEIFGILKEVMDRSIDDQSLLVYLPKEEESEGRLTMDRVDEIIDKIENLD